MVASGRFTIRAFITFSVLRIERKS